MVETVRAEDDAQQLGPACSDQAVHAEDLALPDGEADAVEPAPGADAAHFERDLARPRRPVRERLVQAAPDHEGDERVLVRLRHLDATDEAPSFKTVALSQMRKISSRRCEM